MQKIYLNSDKFVLIDDEDLSLFQSYSWHIAKAKSYQYVRVSIYPNKIKQTIYLHRLIMNNDSKDKVICFLDGNSLNLQKENMILVPRSTKCHLNNKNNIGKTSIYRGVLKRNQKFIARIVVDGKRKYLGKYATEQDAVDIYDFHAIQAFGMFAQVNNINNLNVS
ncbi:hypothetical protein EMA8858_03817 [Emticicia aquatica]|jgi:hypothetical protein|uniref:AP2/ERF domain-containing protein n=1 Tax=Emticicia aquatica TaxID=1681835 RepID=A0ABN8F349_9BACT|nr:hypothetical protein [Emticicia aquatica]CAH0997683.1 hypothetical protein EMA8858_03817 [Emticicia aquatica]